MSAVDRIVKRKEEPIKVISVRELMKLSPDEIHERMKGKYNVLFDDGVVKKLKAREVRINRYFWEISKVHGTPVNHNHDVTEHYSNGFFSKKTSGGVFREMLKDIILGYLVKNRKAVRRNLIGVYKSIMEVNGKIHSFSHDIRRYMVSVDILDILELQLDPRLLDAIKKVEELNTDESIQESYQVMDEVFADPKYSHNPMSRAYLGGMVKKGQAQQTWAAIGKRREINSKIFPKAISSSFTLGLNDLYDFSVESRSAALSLSNSSSAIRDSEYLNRKIQLLCMAVRYIHEGDCGSDEYIDWFVDKHDLNTLEGSYYLDTDGVEKMIDRDSKELIGRTIKFRSILGCKHDDPYGVCSKCFGDMSYNVMEHAVLGHLTGTTLGEKISQSLLSTKHLLASAIIENIILDNIAKQYFKLKITQTSPEGLIYIKNKAKDETTYLLINSQECYGLRDVVDNSDIENILPDKVTRLKTIYFVTEKDGDRIVDEIKLETGGRFGILALKFLDYVKSVGMTMDEYDDTMYKIPMDSWKFKSPMINMSNTEYSFVEFRKAVENIIRTRSTNKNGIAFDTPIVLLNKLYNTVNSKISVNIAVLEVIVYALMANNLEENDFSLSRHSSKPELVSLGRAITGATTSAAYAYDDFMKQLYHFLIHKPDNKRLHPLDTFFMPNEVVYDKEVRELSSYWEPVYKKYDLF